MAPVNRDALVRTILTHPQMVVQLQPSGEYDIKLCRCPVPVTAADIPRELRLALISTEDRRFYSPLHSLGFDPAGVVRAAVDHFRGTREGGSGLDQQIGKNMIDGSEYSIWRKLNELLDASRVEADFDKGQIVAIYLNNMDFGSSDGHEIFGIEQASRAFFGKSTHSLDLYESAVLVGMLKAPSQYSPARHPAAARQRAEHVLARMVDDGYITAKERDLALRTGPRPGRLRPIPLETAYYTSWVRQQLPSGSDLLKGHSELRVVLGLDPAAQLDAQARVADMMREGESLNVHEAALVAMDQDGLVRALVGGADFARNQFDHATMARRQPGSAFKPFVYLQALAEGRTPADTILDEPADAAQGWPHNFDHRYHGVVRLDFAFEQSLNAATARLMNLVGPGNVVALSHRVGIRSELTPDRALALGASEVTPLELTSAYAAIANGGYRADPHGVLAILTMDGTVLWAAADHGRPARVLAAADAATMRTMLRKVVEFGTGQRANFGPGAAGKTGTTQDFKDAWFVGFDRDGGLVTGIWIGNDDGSPMRGVSGSSLPAMAWRQFYVDREPHKLPDRHPSDRTLRTSADLPNVVGGHVVGAGHSTLARGSTPAAVPPPVTVRPVTVPAVAVPAGTRG